MASFEIYHIFTQKYEYGNIWNLNSNSNCLEVGGSCFWILKYGFLNIKYGKKQ